MSRPKLSRRRLLLASTAASLSAGAIGSRGYEPAPPVGQLAQEDVYGFGVRKEAHSLNADSDDVAMYRDAVAWMKQRSLANPLDPLGWAQHWAHHSIFCATNTFQYQVHYGWYFLPWHRAYLANLEQKIRRLLEEPAFALPYWDWTRNPTIPDWYWGEDNPLSNSTRLQERGDVLPPDFLEVGPSLSARAFRHFGGRERIPGELQVEGTLEQSVHNCVHNWIGGEMASFDGAGNDPVFQSHHGQIDRLWEAWLQQEGRANPDAERFLQHPFWFYGPAGFPQLLRVGDLLDTKQLGYRYDDLSYAHTLNDTNTPRLDGKSVDFGALEASEAQLAAIEANVQGQDQSRVTLSYDRLSLPVHPFQHRLFFVEDRPGGESVYAGTFTILPIPDLNQGLEARVSSQVALPPRALARLLEHGRVRVGRPPSTSP